MSVIDLLNPNPPLKHRFGVFFFAGGAIPNPLDFRFQKVSGITAEVELETINEGGENTYRHRLPKKANYQNLVLERGYALVSPLNLEFNAAFTLFKFYPSNVLVTLLSDIGIPLGAWLFIKAYPVKWQVSDLDAQANEVVIDTMELAYTRFQIIRT